LDKTRITIQKSRIFLCASLLLAHWLAYAGQPAALHSSSQLLVVTTSDWNGIPGTIQRYQRDNPGGKWHPVGSPIAVVVGKSGLAWGAGVVPFQWLKAPGAEDPIKKEGDGKAPAGIFRLSTSFGYAPLQEGDWKMPYLRLTDSVECVDDPASEFYNRISDRSRVRPDWKSSEHMLRNDELYRWGIVVDHNSSPPRAGDGSCIFLHIWRGQGQGTVGCTAMPRDHLESLLAWLDPAKKPLLVQLPIAEYKRLRHKLNLP
jgi:hypothetical protein